MQRFMSVLRSGLRRMEVFQVALEDSRRSPIAMALDSTMSPSTTVEQRVRTFANMKLMKHQYPDFDLVEFREGVTAAFDSVRVALKEEEQQPARLSAMLHGDDVVLQLRKAPYLNPDALLGVQNVWIVDIHLLRLGSPLVDEKTHVLGGVDFMKREGSGHDAGASDSDTRIMGAQIEVQYELGASGDAEQDSEQTFSNWTYMGWLEYREGCEAYEWKLQEVR